MLRVLAIMIVLVTACGSATATTTTPSESISGSATPATTATPAVTQTTFSEDASVQPEPDVFDAAAAVFVASLEEAFAGTSFEGAVIAAPEVFVATGEVICVRLDNGDSIDQVLDDYIAGLVSNADGDSDTVSENEAVVVAGGVLGASLELFCPEHKQLLEE